MVRVVFFPEGDFISSSTRIRVYHIAKVLSESGIECRIIQHNIPHIHSSFDYIKKGLFYLYTFFRVLFEFSRTRKDDIIFIHRYSAVPGFLLIDLIPKYLLKRKVIFDFDDAIYLGPSWIKRMIAFEPLRTNLLIKSSDLVIVSSHYLQEYASQYTDKCMLVPTSIDMRRFSSYMRTEWKIGKKVKIGWIGSPTTLRYLNIVRDPLSILGKKYDIEFIVIGANKHEAEVPHFQNITMNVLDWSYDRELEHLSKLDIGVMPLLDSEWEKAKAGFKILEYMALKIPVVASDVGENRYVINDKYDGRLCASTEDWINALEELIKKEKVRQTFGQRGYLKVVDKYSSEKNALAIKEEILKLSESAK